jgi:Mrp family chromosome partitioning ATPase/capsular polysaccharide biosynthesis protein
MNPSDINDRFNPARVLKALQDRAWIIALSVALCSALAFFISRAQAPSYESTVTILSTPAAKDNSSGFGNLIPKPPALPQGALEKVLGSGEIVQRIIASLETQKIGTADERARIKAALEKEVVERKPDTFLLRGRLDLDGKGTYDITATGPSPEMATGLANIAATELVGWDTERGLGLVKQALSTAKAQLNQADARLSGSSLTLTDRESLTATRTKFFEQIGNLQSYMQSATGTLIVLSKAATPVDPVAPKPTRNAALAGLAALLVALSVIVFRTEVNRRVNDEIDLKAFDMRVLGKLPRVPRRRGDNSLQTVLDLSKAVDDVAFVRANLNVLLNKVSGPKIILVTSPLPSDGKSSVTATLADSFAAAGQRTLIIDADLRRAGQQAIWANQTQSNSWVSLPGATQAQSTLRGTSRDISGRDTSSGTSNVIETSNADPRQHNLRTATKEPETAKARKLQDKLHFLPAGPATWRSSEFLSNGSFAAALKRWGTSYDVILIDSPPALAVADAVMLAPLASGVLFVLEPGRTTQEAMARILDAFALGKANLLGVVFNKVNPRSRDRYSYYPPKGALAASGNGRPKSGADLSLNLEAGR